MSSANPIALVTGAGSGIGAASVLALYAAGFSVVLAGRRASELERVAESAVSIGQTGARMLPVAADVTHPYAVESLFEQVRSQFGRLDVLFNNAGIVAPAVPLEDLTVEQWNRVLAVNLTGALLCAQQAVRMMKSQSPRGGRIINNGSISAHVPRPHSAAYTASKHGMTGLTKSIALDGRAFDIACSQIDIGNAATDMTAAMARGVLQPNDSLMVEPVIDVQYVAQAIVNIAQLPLSVNVPFMTLMATQMPYLGRG